MGDPRVLRDLRRYWDDVAQGAPAVPGDLDPELADTIRRLHALPDVPPPDATYATQLRERLMHAGSMPMPRPDPLVSPGLNGRSMLPARPAILPPLPVSRGRRALTHLAMAALVLVTVIGGFLAFGPGRSLRLEHVPAILPAIVGTPATPQTVTTETLLDTAVTSLPEGRLRVAVDRWRLQPSPLAVTLPAHEGVVMITVDAGEITVEADGAERRLTAGDALDVTNQEFAFRASGSEEAIAYVVYGTSQFSAEFGQSIARIWVSGDPLVHTMDFVISSAAEDFPGGAAHLVLERLTLPPGSALPQQEAHPLVWTEVGSGVLGLTLEGERLPYRWQSGVEGELFPFGREILPRPAPGTGMFMRNAGDDPLILYRLTLMPNGAGPPVDAMPRQTTARPSG